MFRPSQISDLIDVRSVAITLFVLAPTIVAASVTGDENWWRASTLAMSVLIATERSDLAPLGMMVHGMVIALSMLALLAALTVPVLFVLGVAGLAGGAAFMSIYGSKLRALGSWTFIPVLYLTVEIKNSYASDACFQQGLRLLPFMALAVLPILLLEGIRYCQIRPSMRNYLTHFFRVINSEKCDEWPVVAQSVVATMIAVACMVVVVQWRHVSHGEWAIWSAASVITGGAVASRRKFRDRMIGASLGVPAGIIVGLLIPHNIIIYASAVAMIMLTLVAFKHYLLAFGTRCACITLCVVSGEQADMIGLTRVSNVLIGGLVGVLVFSLVRAIPQRWRVSISRFR